MPTCLSNQADHNIDSQHRHHRSLQLRCLQRTVDVQQAGMLWLMPARCTHSFGCQASRVCEYSSRSTGTGLLWGRPRAPRP